MSAGVLREARNPWAQLEFPSMGLTDFLEELQQAGQTDSAGGFTLDIQHTLAKLAQFQLDNPRHYVRNLVSAALKLDATSIQFRCGARDTIAVFDGPVLHQGDLTNLFQSLFETRPNRRSQGLSQLAYAVNAARQLASGFLVFDSWGNGGGARLQIYNGLLHIASLSQAPWPARCKFQHRFHLREAWGTDLLPRLLPSQVAETHSLRDSCRFSPLPVWVNGQLLEPTDLHVLETWLEGGAALRQHRQPIIHWVVEGIAYQEKLPITSPPHLCLWLHCDELRRDISQRGLVDGPELAARRLQVQDFIARSLPAWRQRAQRNYFSARQFERFVQ